MGPGPRAILIDQRLAAGSIRCTQARAADIRRGGYPPYSSPAAGRLLAVVAVMQIYRPSSRLRGAPYAILGVAVGSAVSAVVLGGLFFVIMMED